MTLGSLKVKIRFFNATIVVSKGHTIERCYKLIGFSKYFKHKKDFNNTNKFSNNTYVAASHVNESSNASSCYVDKAYQHFLTFDQYSKIMSLKSEKQFVEDMFANANMAVFFSTTSKSYH